ncbi:metal ABC transporter solute-binding protein, Zn/Mn family [Lactobacillus acetotolerans]|uniref:metal ABC transporter solute-binding protein, Zn/Mn family n=1 Tax=Lactobacillus acetotolerans TaxID=1600 RepID=UPI0007BADCD1|nr:zinc ABC transporter substrate-binding protein [Lactobacillus acetotolerans]QGV04055.1 metal ABC transporter substrate-binding protein [Lactobacillus acetotolerans]
MKKLTRLKNLLTFAGIIGALVLVLSACSQQPKKSSKISIVTTTNIYADIAQNVVGKYGKATPLIKSGSMDPHDFEPKTSDANLLSGANIVVANGLGYDSWMNNLSSSVDKKPLLVGEDLMGLKKGDNPHIWYNLHMPTKYVNYLVKRLSKIDKKHAAYYRANGKNYLKKIDKIKKITAGIDGRNKKPVYVSEPVFDYALKSVHFKIGDKNFEQAIQNNTDPSPAMVQTMTENIKKRKIAFFVNNSQVSSSTVNNFIEQAKAKNIPVVSVRETIPNHTTYLNWMTNNYHKLAKVAKK